MRELQPRPGPVVDDDELAARRTRDVRRAQVVTSERDVRGPQVARLDEVDLLAAAGLVARLDDRDAALEQRADVDVALAVDRERVACREAGDADDRCAAVRQQWHALADLTGPRHGPRPDSSRERFRDVDLRPVR